MSEEYLRCYAEISIENIRHNLLQARSRIPEDTKLLVVLKANAYGHGVENIAKSLLDVADYYAVATVNEALELREDGVAIPILVLGYASPKEYPAMISHNVTATIYREEDARLLSETAVKLGMDAHVHAAADTGMTRIGFKTDASGADAIAHIAKLPGIRLEGMFTHFSCADQQDQTYTMQQISRYENLIQLLKERNVTIPIRHVCNSAGIMRFPGMHLDMVRAGIILYGLTPPGCPPAKKEINLIPVMSWFAKVIHMKTIPVGTSVSYGRHFTAERPTKVLTVSIGYADGLTRRYSNGFELMVAGQRAPIIGNVCMDMCMLDATDISEYVGVRSLVTVFGKHRSVDELADYLGTINYEITCIIGKRVPRIYAEDVID